MIPQAILSEDLKYRYWLTRYVQPEGKVFAFFGVNPSTADADVEDATTRKWRGFAVRNGCKSYIAVNPFAFRSTDVKQLAKESDPNGPDNDMYLRLAVDSADVIIPCWGSLSKLPIKLRPHVGEVLKQILVSSKTVLTFGLTKSRDPMHPLMLGYDTKLVDLREVLFPERQMEVML